MATTKQKPSCLRDAAMQRIVENFPDELLLAPQWVLWKMEQRDGSPTKVPYQPCGFKAKSTNNATWSCFQNVWDAFIKNPSFDGVGFVFTPDDPYVGIDLDKCRDPATGKVEEWAQDIVNRFNTYVELSPSGKGFHIIGKGTLPNEGKRRKSRVEMYDSGRYFTVTGDRYGNAPIEANDIHEEVIELHHETFGAQAQVGTPKASKFPSNATRIGTLSVTALAHSSPDQAIVDEILASKDRSKFQLFQSGNWAALGYPSQSEGDLAFAGMLARHVGEDPVRVDSLFRASGMMRDKWDEMRGTQTYGEMTIAQALTSMQSVNQSDEFIAQMNTRYAIICVGNKVKILEQSSCEPDFKLFSKSDFELKTANLPTAPNGCRAANFWLKSPNRNEFSGLVFSPGKDVAGSYNLWRGFSVKAIAGKCPLFWDFVLQVICAGNVVIYLYIRCYFAHMIQRPWERPEVAIVLRSGQGTGKNTFVDTMGALVAHHFRQVNGMDQITGRFNGHMQNVILLHANEATWGGNKSEKGKLKAMITDATVPVEMKGLDIVHIENYLRLVVSSNENWPVPIDLDDRRFLVLDVSPIHKQDTAYFAAIHAELDNGGREALMYDLTTEDLTGFSPRNKPTSPFGADIKLRSADSPTRWLYDFLNDNEWMEGNKVFAQPSAQVEVGKSNLYNDYEQWSRSSPERYAASRDQFFKAIRGNLGSSMTDLRTSAKPGVARERKFILSSLTSCRIAFESATGTVGCIEWESQ